MEEQLQGDIAPISDEDFARMQALIHSEAGIFLPPVKRSLLVGRLSRRLRTLGINSFEKYYEHVASPDNDERRHMLDAICTNETEFFRDRRQFEFLRSVVLPRLASRGSQTIRIWSAGCSTGEEPYSIAMTALDLFGDPPRPSLDIVGTDLSSRVLASACSGVWSARALEKIPDHYLKQFMLRGVGANEGTVAASDPVRSVLRFARINLNEALPQKWGTFDVIFCRNVMIYFDDETRASVVRRLLAHLNPGGYFFLGHAESLASMATPARSVGPTVYQMPEQTV